MEKEERIPDIFPSDYAYLNQPVWEVHKRVKGIDLQISQLPPDRDVRRPGGPTPPPGVRIIDTPGLTRDQKIRILTYEKESLQDNIMKLVKQETATVDKAYAKQVKDSAERYVFVTDIDSKTAKEIESLRSEPKNLNRSQDFMRTLRQGAQDHHKLRPFIDNDPSKNNVSRRDDIDLDRE